MSKFNHYAKDFDSIAKRAFAEYRSAEINLKRAEDARKAFPIRNGVVTAGYAANCAKAQANYLEAVQMVEAVRKKMIEGVYQDEICELKTDLENELSKTFAVDPAKIDSNMLELLKSGIMSTSDYNTMMKKAMDSDNITMARLIGKYADQAAQERENNPMIGRDATTAQLRALAVQSQGYTGNNYIESFNVLSYTFERCAANPAMIDSWDTMTADIVASF